MRGQGTGGGGPRPPLLMDDALQRVRDEGRGEDAQEGAGGNPELVEEGLCRLVPGRAQLRRPVGPQRCKGFRSIACFRTMIFLRLGRLDFTAQKKLTCATH